VTLTIRKFNTRHVEMNDLIRCGTLNQQLANQLEDYVLQRKNILISGGTGTGKTTLASILIKFIPEDGRILVIEDTAELHVPRPNLVRFEARPEQNGVQPAPFATFSKPLYGIAPIACCSAKFEAPRLSISCNC